MPASFFLFRRVCKICFAGFSIYCRKGLCQAKAAGGFPLHVGKYLA